MSINNLEQELDLCPLMKTCNPDDNEIEDYCAINYSNCEIYIKKEAKKK